jgi:hypothetical protein
MTGDERDPDEPTPGEIAEAEALARALERGAAAGPDVPEDALAAAALLRHAHAAGSAQADAEARARVAAAATRGRDALNARRPRRRRWLAPAIFLPAAAGVILYASTLRRNAAVNAPVSLPPPSLALLEEQARAARGREGLDALDRQMRTYRSTFYASLARRESGR